MRRDVSEELYGRDTVEREVGDLFDYGGCRFMVVEAEGVGCEGCALYVEDDMPCVGVYESGACCGRADGRDVVFVVWEGKLKLRRTREAKSRDRRRKMAERGG